MDITLAKFTPFKTPHKKGTKGYIAGYADFDIKEGMLSFKVKGNYVVFYSGRVYLKLPTIPQRDKKKPRYSPFAWNGPQLMDEFIQKGTKEIMDKWPPDKWKDGMWSKFKQGIK